MENKISDSVRKTDVKKNQANEIQAGEKIKKTGEEYGRKRVELKRNYDAISKNGDTLELSEEGRKKAGNPAAEGTSCFGKKVISDAGTGKKISENILAGFSASKLRQLYANKEITRQQYERIMKKKKAK